MAVAIQTERKARDIANRIIRNAEEKGGPLRAFDIVSMLPAIIAAISAFAKCFEPDDGEQAQEYVAGEYNQQRYQEKHGHYRKSTFMKATRAVKFSNASEGRRLTWPQSREIAIAMLDDVRESEDRQELSLVISEQRDGSLPVTIRVPSQRGIPLDSPDIEETLRALGIMGGDLPADSEIDD